MGYALVLVGILSILLSLFLFHQNRSRYNLRFDFGILMTFAGLWAVCIGIFFASQGNLLAIHVNYIVALMMVYCLAAFSMRLDGRRSKLVAIPHLAGLLVSLALAVILFYDSTWIISSLDFINTINVVVQVNSHGYLSYALAFSAAYFAAVLFLLNAIFRNLKSERNKYIQILMSILVVGFTGLFTNLYLPSIGDYTLIWMAPVLVVLVVFTASVSIIRYKTFDIKLAAVRSVAYTLSLLTLALIYYAIAYFVSVALFQNEASSTVSISPINIALALMLAFIFQPIKNFFDRITNNIFFRDRYSADEFYAQLNETLTSTTDLRTLLQRVSIQISNTLKSEQALFYIQYNHRHHISAGTTQHQPLPLSDVHQLNEYVKQEGTETIVTELLPEQHDIRRLLVSHKIAILMPLMNDTTVLGYLALGEHRTGNYTSRDIRVLNTVADELVIAIQNALSIKEVKDINASLEQRIRAATKELRANNRQLRHLDAVKDEFLSMASHQLRTPLTSIKGYLSMTLDGDVGKLSKAQRNVLGEAYVSSERMVNLIHDFLNVSRLQTGKFILEKRPIDLGEVVKAELKALVRIAESRSIKLTAELSDVPRLNVDEGKLRQVIMNFVDNALYYSLPDTEVTVYLGVKDDAVELTVRDHGIGVPRAERKQLFEKFYRASNARERRPDGTGVGLYLAKKVIDAHGGTLIFVAHKDGSSFGFSLPVKDLAVEEMDDK